MRTRSCWYNTWNACIHSEYCNCNWKKKNYLNLYCLIFHLRWNRTPFKCIVKLRREKTAFAFVCRPVFDTLRCRRLASNFEMHLKSRGLFFLTVNSTFRKIVSLFKFIIHFPISFIHFYVTMERFLLFFADNLFMAMIWSCVFTESQYLTKMIFCVYKSKLAKYFFFFFLMLYFCTNSQTVTFFWILAPTLLIFTFLVFLFIFFLKFTTFNDF